MVLTWLMKRALYKFFLLYIKMSESAYLTYYQKNRDVILNRAKDYYENDKERLRVQAKVEANIENYLKNKKIKKREHGKNRYRNIPEEKKQRLKKYQKNYRKVRKSQYNSE